MTKYDGRRWGDPRSDRGITWALVIGLVTIVAVGGVLYGNSGSSPNATGSASASSER
jgi:hypothetical protein